jgi:hypothetical protein
MDSSNPVASPVTVYTSGTWARNLTIDSDDSLSLANGSTLGVAIGSLLCPGGGHMINNGKITLNSTGTTTRLFGGLSLYNGGTVTLTDSTNPQNVINGFGLWNSGMIQGAGNIATGTITNNGTLQVAGGSVMHVSGGSFTNFSGSTLTGGTYNVSGKLQIDQLGSAGGEIVTNAANIILHGSASSFVDASGKNALSKFATNAPGGSFSLRAGRTFTASGNFSNAGTLTIGSGSTFAVGGTGTTFTQTAGTTTDDGTLTLPASGALSLNAGSLFGKGVINGAVTSSGTVTPGDSSTATGILRDMGKYNQKSAGTLHISIDGTTAGTQYDQFNPTTATLNGTLSINRPTGFVPALGATLKVMNFTSETGKFATLNGLAINSTEHFSVNYQASDVLLSVVSGPCCSALSLARFKGWGTVAPRYESAGPDRFASGLYGKGTSFLSPRGSSIAAFGSPTPGERLAFRPSHNFSASIAAHNFVIARANGAVRYRIDAVGGQRNIGHAQRTSVPRGVGYHLDLFPILGSSPRHLWRDLLGPNSSNFGYLTVQ